MDSEQVKEEDAMDLDAELEPDPVALNNPPLPPPLLVQSSVEGAVPVELGIITSRVVTPERLDEATFGEAILQALHSLSTLVHDASLCIVRGLMTESTSDRTWGSKLTMAWFLSRRIPLLTYREEWRDMLTAATDVILVAGEEDPGNRQHNPVLDAAIRSGKLLALIVVPTDPSTSPGIDVRYYPSRGPQRTKQMAEEVANEPSKRARVEDS